MINKKYLKEYISIKENWLITNNNVEIQDDGFIFYREVDKIKVLLGTIDRVTGRTGGAVIYVEYLDYQLEVRRLKINKILSNIIS